jgi:hypothetical protein
VLETFSLEESLASYNALKRLLREKTSGIARFLSVFSLLSRIPIKRPFDIDFSRADFWIPPSRHWYPSPR